MNLNILELGITPYKEALHIQEALRKLRLAVKIDDTLILLEHFPVITLGKSAKYSNILAPRKVLDKEKIAVYKVNRGGDVTYHGPGQLVGYLIFNLKNQGRDIKKFISNIQEVILRFLKSFNIEGSRKDKAYTGVWVGNKKIMALGIEVYRWVTMHGFALNINTNLLHYKLINPCGITDKGITSLKTLMKKKINFQKAREQIATLFSEVFAMNPVFVNQEEILKEYKREYVCIPLNQTG